MAATEPIRDKGELKNFMEYYRRTEPNVRNYALIVLGLHTALRISDILMLKWKDVFDFETQLFCGHLYVHEKKTGKQNIIALNSHVTDALWSFRQVRKPQPEDFIFTKNSNYGIPLSRSQAFRIVKRAAEISIHASHVSCHSLRKTFGYHAWKQGTPPALLMDIYNHSSYRVTKRYLGIDQDDRDSVFMKIDL